MRAEFGTKMLTALALSVLALLPLTSRGNNQSPASDLPTPKLANVITMEGVLCFLPFLLLLHRRNVKSECNFISLQLRQCDSKTRSKCKFQTKIKVRYIETKSFFFQTLLRCVQGRRVVVWTDTTGKTDGLVLFGRAV